MGVPVLLAFVGLLATAIHYWLPMTGWQAPRWLARIITIIAAVTLVIAVGVFFLDNVGAIKRPVAFIAAILSSPVTHAVLWQGMVVLAIFILFTVLAIRPLFISAQEIQRSLVRYVLPRHLTEEQMSVISEALKGHPGAKIVLQEPKEYGEASAFRADFQRALAGAGWEVSNEFVDDIREGITIHLTQPLRSPGDNAKTEAEKLLEALRGALEKARIRIDGSGGGGSRTTTVSKLVLSIGRRRMDDGHVRARQHLLQRLKEELLKDSDEYD